MDDSPQRGAQRHTIILSWLRFSMSCCRTWITLWMSGAVVVAMAHVRSTKGALEWRCWGELRKQAIEVVVKWKEEEEAGKEKRQGGKKTLVCVLHHHAPCTTNISGRCFNLLSLLLMLHAPCPIIDMAVWVWFALSSIFHLPYLPPTNKITFSSSFLPFFPFRTWQNSPICSLPTTRSSLHSISKKTSPPLIMVAMSWAKTRRSLFYTAKQKAFWLVYLSLMKSLNNLDAGK